MNSILPAETWSEIFRLATAIQTFDYPPPIGRMSSDLITDLRRSIRFRKTILCVCRTWKSAGLHLLFEHILITEIPQLAKIVQLVECEDGPSRWIRSIYVGCVVMGHWHDFYDDQMARLIFSCPNMRHLIDRVVDGQLVTGSTDAFQS